MKNKLKKATGAVMAAALLLGGLAMPSPNAQAASKTVSISKKAKITVGKTAKIQLKNNKKKVKWKVVKGKKLIRLTKKTKTYVKVKGIKKGTAKIQAVVGKKKYTCKVTVSAAKKKPAVTGKPQTTKKPVPTSDPSGNTPDATLEPRTIVYTGTNEAEIRYAKEPIAVVVKDGVKEIEWLTFRGCSNLTSITLPNSVTTIGSDAFEGCSSLTSITIPESVTDIRGNAFSGCSSLSKINVSEKNKEYDSRGDCNAIIHTYSNALISGCKNTVIPDSVTGIGSDAFEGCSGLTSITIPDSVTEIRESAFEGCRGLTSITIPGSVTGIQDNAFKGCSSLSKIKVSEKNKEYDSRGDCNAIIGTKTNWLIWGCKNTVIPESVTGIMEYAFYECSGLTSITIPESVTEIQDNAFSGCSSLSKIKVSEKNKTYDSRGDCNAIIYTNDNRLIVGCKDTVIPESVEWIGHDAFSGCSNLTGITIPKNVMSIGKSAFEGCSSLTGITIPKNVTSIGNSAFEGCSSLTSVTISEGVKEMVNTAFKGCSSLTSITIPGSMTRIEIETVSDNPFSGCNSLSKIKVSENNKVYDSRDDCNAIVETETNELIVGCKGTVIPESVTSIRGGAFYKCSSPKNITIPKNVMSIGNGAFEGCSSLTSITIPEGVTTIQEFTFEGCSSLTSVTLPDSLTEIGRLAFSGCINLKSISMPEKVSLGDDVFDGCSHLTITKRKGAADIMKEGCA